MTELEQFEQDLEEALNAREAEVRDSLLGQLKQCYVRIQSSYEALHNVLKKKGLIVSDPYNYEERISKITVPSDQPFLDSERDKELSIRTAKYLAQLTFVNNYLDFSLDHLDLRRLKTLVQFTRYFNWPNFSENATQPTTRALAEQALKVKRGTDQLSANIVADAQEQLSSATREALDLLKRITAYRRERYKLDVRRNVLPACGLASEITSPEQAITKVRSVWQKTMTDRPFARELILEIFSENGSEGGPAARRVLLESLKSAAKPDKRKKDPNQGLKELLLESARSLASCSRSLEEASHKLNDNVAILESRKLSFAEVIRAVIRRLRGKTDKEHVYLVEYVDEKTGARATEEIAFERFIASLMRRSRIYSGILSRTGNAWTRLQHSPEEELLQFVTTDTQELALMVRRLESLETMFRAEVDREQRNRLRGVNAELITMREHLQRARKKNHEYVAKYEEIEQLRRLGIDPAE